MRFVDRRLSACGMGGERHRVPPSSGHGPRAPRRAASGVVGQASAKARGRARPRSSRRNGRNRSRRRRPSRRRRTGSTRRRGCRAPGLRRPSAGPVSYQREGAASARARRRRMRQTASGACQPRSSTPGRARSSLSRGPAPMKRAGSPAAAAASATRSAPFSRVRRPTYAMASPRAGSAGAACADAHRIVDAVVGERKPVRRSPIRATLASQTWMTSRRRRFRARAQGDGAADPHELVQAAPAVAGRGDAGGRERRQGAGLGLVEAVIDPVRAGEEVIVQGRDHRARRARTGPGSTLGDRLRVHWWRWIEVGPHRQRVEGGAERGRRPARPRARRGRPRCAGRCQMSVLPRLDPADARMVEERVRRPVDGLDVGDVDPRLGEAAGRFDRDLLGAPARHGELGQHDDLHGMSEDVDGARSRAAANERREVYRRSTHVR